MIFGWIVRIEAEAGEGELEPLLYAVALSDPRDAMSVAQESPEVVAPHIVLGSKAPTIHRCELIAPVRFETLRRLNLQPEDVWRL